MPSFRAYSTLDAPHYAALTCLHRCCVACHVARAVVNRKSKAKALDHRRGIHMVVYNMEAAVRAAEAAGQEKWVWIIDLADYTRANSPPLSITRETLNIMSSHYPERLFRYAAPRCHAG